MAGRPRLANGLTQQQEDFARAVADGKTQADAYRSSFSVRPGTKPNTVWNEASKLADRPKVAARIEELSAIVAKRAQKQSNITTDWLTERWRRIAEFDARKLFDEDGKLKRIVDLDDDTAYVISSVDVSLTKMQGRDRDEVIEEVTKKVRMWDKGKALENIGRHIGYYNEDTSQAPRIILSGFARPKRGG